MIHVLAEAVKSIRTAAEEIYNVLMYFERTDYFDYGIR